uniref:Uncharacterized protein n=1 Tax=Triticum urartu TaxID=4572 RepID=A0A8R7UZG5_TRIUA
MSVSLCVSCVQAIHCVCLTVCDVRLSMCVSSSVSCVQVLHYLCVTVFDCLDGVILIVLLPIWSVQYVSYSCFACVPMASPHIWGCVQGCKPFRLFRAGRDPEMCAGQASLLLIDDDRLSKKV